MFSTGSKLADFDAYWHNWSVGEGHEMVNFGVPRSKVNVTHSQNRQQKSLSATNFNQAWEAHIMVNAHYVTTAGMQKVKAQGYMRLKLNLDSWRRHHSRPLCSCSFSS